MADATLAPQRKPHRLCRYYLYVALAYLVDFSIMHRLLTKLSHFLDCNIGNLAPRTVWTSQRSKGQIPGSKYAFIS
jgi:hypothetical protein